MSHSRSRWIKCGVSHISRVKNSFLPFNSTSDDKYFKTSRISRFHKFIIHGYCCANYHRNIRSCLPCGLLPSLLGSFMCINIGSYNKMHTQVQSNERYTMLVHFIDPTCDARTFFYQNNVEDE